jgi:hypothetical protein
MYLEIGMKLKNSTSRTIRIGIWNHKVFWNRRIRKYYDYV